MTHTPPRIMREISPNYALNMQQKHEIMRLEMSYYALIMQRNLPKSALIQYILCTFLKFYHSVMAFLLYLGGNQVKFEDG